MQISGLPEIESNAIVDGDWLILQTNPGGLTRKIRLSELFLNRGGGMVSRIRDDSGAFTPANNDRVVLTIAANYPLTLPPAPYPGYFFSVLPTNTTALKRVRLGSSNFLFQGATQSVYLKDPYEETGFLYVDNTLGWIATRQDTLTLAGSDPQWANVKILLPFEGVNGGVSFPELKNNLVVTKTGNVVTSTVQSKFGAGSAYFDGTGGYLRIAPQTDFPASFFDLPGDFCLEFWRYIVSNGASGTMPCFRDNGDMVSGGFYAIYSGGVFYFGSGGNNVIAQSYTPTLNQWGHCAVTRQGNVYRYFEGGVKLAEVTNAWNPPNTAGGLTIGRFSNGNYNATFYLNDLRLTALNHRYSDAFTPPTEAFPRG